MINPYRQTRPTLDWPGASRRRFPVRGSRRGLWLAYLFFILCPSVPLWGLTQSDATPVVPRFPIESSTLALRYDVRPHQYVGVMGRKAAWLGVETGEAEVWVHPLKLGNDFHLSFKIPDYVTPIDGADIARTVIVRPELTTIVYSHATFTVRQHILASLDNPALLVLLEVDTDRPLEIVASFKAVLQYAWPGALGGVYAFWSPELHAFVLSESQQKRNAIIGSPWSASGSNHPAHAVPDAPSTFVIPVDSARARREFIPIAIAGGTAPRDTVVAWYNRIMRHARDEYQRRREHAASLLDETTTIDSPDQRLDLAYAWARINLDEQMVCNPDLGCGLVAGWGPSGQGTRPGFGWFFGGDAAINSFAMDAVGMWSQTATGLRFLATYQNRDDGPRHGKIPHEISQSAGTIPWFTDFPYAYYHADTTPYWIVAVWRYWRASGDDALVQSLWPNILEAHAWGLRHDSDGDGIIENGPGNLGAIEVGALGEGIHEDIYLAAVWIESLRAITEMATRFGSADVAREATNLRDRALQTLNERYWREREGHHAFGIMRSGITNDNLTAWPATAASFGLLERTAARKTLAKLTTDSIATPWGARMLSTASPLYDATHYNNGAVWPFVTGFVSLGQYVYDRPWAAYPFIHGLAQLAFDWARGRFPELLSGRYYRPLDTTVPQQFFATSMLVTPLITGMLGWDPDAPAGRATLKPQLPPDWDRFSVQNLRVGGTRLDLTFMRQAESMALRVVRSGPAIALDLTLTAPPGSSAWRTETGAISVDTSNGDAKVRRTVQLTAPDTTLLLTWDGGLEVVPPRPELRPGQTSDGVRIVDFRRREHDWMLLVEGDTGVTSHVELIGQTVQNASGARVRSSGHKTTLEIELAGPNPRSSRSIIIR